MGKWALLGMELGNYSLSDITILYYIYHLKILQKQMKCCCEEKK